MDKMEQNNIYLAPTKRLIKVTISKALMTIINVFGFGAFFSGLYLSYINVDIFTRSVLQLLGCIFMLFKIVQAVDTWWHKRHMNKIERRREDLAQTKIEEEYIREHPLL